MVIKRQALTTGMYTVFSGMLKILRFTVMANAISNVHMVSGIQAQTEEMHMHRLTRDFTLF